MTNDHPQPNTVTVPIGLGGKTAPYMPDPAPTLLVEFPSVQTERELDSLEVQRTETEEEASVILASAASEAAELVESARLEAEILRSQAEETATSRMTEIETRERLLDDLGDELDGRKEALADRERTLDERFRSIDAEAAEATAALTAAREAASEILAEARTAADQLLEHARTYATEEADAILTAARAGAESDSALEERIAEIESVHRIEVQVLHQREIELHERIARLEQSLAAQAEIPVVRSEAPSEVPARTSEAPSDEIVAESERDVDEIALDLDHESDDGERVTSGRHAADAPRNGADVNGSSHLAAYAPLTEQLSVGAFRASDDRRGRRKR